MEQVEILLDRHPLGGFCLVGNTFSSSTFNADTSATRRPNGRQINQRPLHFVWVAAVSGSTRISSCFRQSDAAKHISVSQRNRKRGERKKCGRRTGSPESAENQSIISVVSTFAEVRDERNQSGRLEFRAAGQRRRLRHLRLHPLTLKQTAQFWPDRISLQTKRQGNAETLMNGYQCQVYRCDDQQARLGLGRGTDASASLSPDCASPHSIGCGSTHLQQIFSHFLE